MEHLIASAACYTIIDGTRLLWTGYLFQLQKQIYSVICGRQGQSRDSTSTMYISATSTKFIVYSLGGIREKGQLNHHLYQS